MTLLAINTATLGIIATKIQDLIIKNPEIDFDNPIKEMKISLIEQIVLIVCSTICLILFDGKNFNFNHKEFLLNTLLIANFIYSIYILWDTGNAVFVIIDEVRKNKDIKV
ncbi:MAG: hypothetical protein KL787_08885 [Taibaiella sp.]|nr:hypothetical protein [Taibaiella sp.]